MLLHGRKAHRIAAGQFGHRLLAPQYHRDDVSPGGVGERVEDPVGARSEEFLTEGFAAGRRCLRSAAGDRAGTAHEPAPAMLAIQATPNRSVHMPNESPQGAFSSGTPTVPPAESLSQ
jgi:hypothetical protein